jgi:hypothetical protein
MIFPQTKPTSANEANREIIVKTMFEHEQHESWLLGRTNRRYWAGHFGQTNPRSRPRQLFRQSEPKRPISQRFSQTNLRGRLRHGCALRRTLTRAGRGVLARIPLEPILSASCAGRAPRRQGRRGPRCPGERRSGPRAPLAHVASGSRISLRTGQACADCVNLSASRERSLHSSRTRGLSLAQPSGSIQSCIAPAGTSLLG